MKKILLWTAGISIASLGAVAQAQPVNIALGKAAKFNIKPSYPLSTDPDDTVQLTDGKYSSEGELRGSGSLWAQRGTVGWAKSRVFPIVITFDLGSVQPISGVSYSTAARVSSSVFWPTAIHIAVSDDKKIWRYAGNLSQLSTKNGLPPSEGDKHVLHRFVTHDLQTKGRYIALGVKSPKMVFCDEIEVYRGEEAWLTRPTPGQVVPPLEKSTPEMDVAAGVQHRIHYDIAAIKNAINASRLAPERKSALTGKLDSCAAVALQSQLKPLPMDFKFILPLNDVHRDVLAVWGEFLATQGFGPTTVWRQHRYAWLPLLSKPLNQEKGLSETAEWDLAFGVPNVYDQESVALKFSMLRNQFRSDSLLVTNASGQHQNVELRLKDLAQGALADWLQVSSVAWVDTAQGTPVADAQFPVEPQNGVYTIDVPAGMTRKVWLTVDSSKLEAGIRKGSLEVKSGNQTHSVPLTLDISKIVMNQPRLSVKMADWTHNPPRYSVTEQNLESAIALMRSHYVDNPWAHPTILPYPVAGDFNARNELTGKLDFTDFDKWVESHKGARFFTVFLARELPRYGGGDFADAKMGTPEFYQRLGSWAKALANHMKQLGYEPRQLAFHIADEPKSEKDDNIIEAWSKAIKEAVPELRLYQNPNWNRIKKNLDENREPFRYADMLCPHLKHLTDGGAEARAYYRKWVDSGKDLWFYQTYGPARFSDPQRYYRYQGWFSYFYGAVGQGFWAYSDVRGNSTLADGAAEVRSSFNEFGTPRDNSAPVYFDTDRVYNSIHWDAAREGVEDYETLAMLQDAINASKNATWKQQAQRTLDEAVKAITDNRDPAISWLQESDVELVDRELRKVRAKLDEVSSPS